MTESLALVPLAPAQIARATIAHHSRSFALASRLLDRETRDRAAIVYTFCRRADDAVDAVPARHAPEAVARLERELDTVYGEASADPVLAAFAAIVRERAIPRAYPAELIAGMAMDAAGTRYETLAELQRYCFRVAGTVGLMMSHVFGLRDDAALVPAARLGLAMQLTNICRDVAEDWARDRLYIPDEVLARHGAAGLAGELGGSLPASAVAPLATCVRELLAIADREYRAAEDGIPSLPWRAALAVRAARSVYAAIGHRIRAQHHDVTAGRAVVRRSKKLSLVVRAALRTVASLPVRAFAGPLHVPARILEARDVPFT